MGRHDAGGGPEVRAREDGAEGLGRRVPARARAGTCSRAPREEQCAHSGRPGTRGGDAARARALEVPRRVRLPERDVHDRAARSPRQQGRRAADARAQGLGFPADGDRGRRGEARLPPRHGRVVHDGVRGAPEALGREASGLAAGEGGRRRSRDARRSDARDDDRAEGAVGDERDRGARRHVAARGHVREVDERHDDGADRRGARGERAQALPRRSRLPEREALPLEP